MLHVDGNAVEPNPHRRAVAIELRVVGARRDDVFLRRTGNRLRDERPNEQPRDRRVPVRKMNRPAGRVGARLVLASVLSAGFVDQSGGVGSSFIP
jgi:hypothetical protein